MILETVRIVADWLEHPTYGVNAKLAGLVLDAGDSTPPLIQVITDETRDFETAVGRLPDTRPCLAINLAADVELEPEVMSTVRNAHISLVIRYGMDDNATDSGIRDTFYTMRAVEQSIRDLNRNDNASARERNGIIVNACTGMRHLMAFKSVDDTVITTALHLTFQVRDTQP